MRMTSIVVAALVGFAVTQEVNAGPLPLCLACVSTESTTKMSVLFNETLTAPRVTFNETTQPLLPGMSGNQFVLGTLSIENPSSASTMRACAKSESADGTKVTFTNEGNPASTIAGYIGDPAEYGDNLKIGQDYDTDNCYLIGQGELKNVPVKYMGGSGKIEPGVFSAIIKFVAYSE